VGGVPQGAEKAWHVHSVGVEEEKSELHRANRHTKVRGKSKLKGLEESSGLRKMEGLEAEKWSGDER